MLIVTIADDLSEVTFQDVSEIIECYLHFNGPLPVERGLVSFSIGFLPQRVLEHNVSE